MAKPLVTVNVEIVILWDVTLCVLIDRFQKESAIPIIMVEGGGAAGYSGYQNTQLHTPENHSHMLWREFPHLM